MNKYIEDFKKHGYELLDKTIINIQQNEYIDIIDNIGYKYHIYYNAIYKTWNPKKWGKNNPYSIENIKLYLKQNNYKCELISTEYNYKMLSCKCQCGNIYNIQAGNLLFKKMDTCPQCSAKRGGIKNIKNKYLKFAEDNNLILYQDEYKGCKNKTYFKNKDGYIVCGTLYNAVNNSGMSIFKHSIFSLYNKYVLYNINHYIELNTKDKKYLTQIISVDKIKSDSSFKCGKCNKEFKRNTQYFIYEKAFYCNECNSKELSNQRIKNFNYEQSIFAKYNLNLLEPYTNKKNEILCITKEGYLIKESENNLSAKSNYLSKVFHICNPYVIDNIKTFITNNNIDCEIVSNKYYGNKSKLTFKCKCGCLFKISLIDFIKGNRQCSNCRNTIKSKLEENTAIILQQFNIQYIQQFTFDDCKDKQLLPFDFYLPDYNICIECQGKQHFEIIDYFGGEERFNYTKKHDNIKKEYCDNNNIKLVYIDYTENDINSIKTIISNITLEK